MISDFVTGFRYFFRGLSYLMRHPVLWKFAIAPMGINVVIFGGGSALFLLKLGSLLDRFVQGEGLWSSVLYFVLATVLVLSFVVAAFYLFTMIGSLIAAPFNSVLSQRTEKLIQATPGALDEGFWHGAMHAFKTEIKKVLVWVFCLIPILLINLLPVIGQMMAAALMLMYTTAGLCFNFMDYTMERHHKGVMERYRILGTRKAMSVGFGTACFVFGLIPLINLMMMPVCVTAGTLLYHGEYRPHLITSDRTTS